MMLANTSQPSLPGRKPAMRTILLASVVALAIGPLIARADGGADRQPAAPRDQRAVPAAPSQDVGLGVAVPEDRRGADSGLAIERCCAGAGLPYGAGYEARQRARGFGFGRRMGRGWAGGG
jgi:hypothetical protein